MNRNEEQPKSGINSKVNNLDSSTYIYIINIYIYAHMYVWGNPVNIRVNYDEEQVNKYIVKFNWKVFNFWGGS